MKLEHTRKAAHVSLALPSARPSEREAPRSFCWCDRGRRSYAGVLQVALFRNVCCFEGFGARHVRHAAEIGVCVVTLWADTGTMMRPAAGVASRGRAAAVRVAATAASRRAGGRRDFVQNALPSNSSSSTSAVGFLSSKATSSTSYSQHISDDGKDLTHWAVLAVGSALALWTAAATSSDDKAGGVPAVACSAAMEKNSNHHHGDARGQPSVDAPRRLTKRRSILLAEDEVDKQSGQSYYSPSLPSAAAGGEAPFPPADPTVSDNAPGVSLVVASTYNGNGPIEDRHDIRQSPRGDFFVSVLDGHGGWQAAELARKRLNIAAQTELKTSLAGNPDQVGGWLRASWRNFENILEFPPCEMRCVRGESMMVTMTSHRGNLLSHGKNTLHVLYGVAVRSGICLRRGESHSNPRCTGEIELPLPL